MNSFPPPGPVFTSITHEERVATFVSIYVNEAQVVVTPWDILLRLSELVPDDQSWRLLRLADVRMAWPLARKFITLVSAQLDHAEKEMARLGGPPAAESIQ